MYTISVCFESGTLPPLRLKPAAAEQTLLEFLLRNDIGIRHDCGGVCYCTTCHVYIEKGEAFIEGPTKRETDFLRKVANRDSTSRLACQCLLLQGKGEIKIRLPAIP